jgi:hypothetical protein
VRLAWRLRRPSAFASLALLILGASACAPAPSPIEKGLRGFLAGEVLPANVEIRYSDLHALHGGQDLTVGGTGVVEVVVVRQPDPHPSNLSADQVRELVALLIELEAWSQRASERQAHPDESRARLTIRVGAQRSEIWEWYNELTGKQRIVRVRDAMRRLASMQ